MPAFGQVESQNIPGGVGIVPVPSGDPRQIEQFHRQMQLDRMKVKSEPAAVSKLSRQTQVYIYSVGAWAQVVQLASLGTHTIPGIPEENCLIPGDLTVSKVLTVPGIPSEVYPVDDGGRHIYHQPKEGDPLADHTGMHLAKEIIGAGLKSKADADLRPWGCFVSEVPEQKDPGPSGTPEEKKLFAQWKHNVETAKSALASNYARIKGKANEAFKNGVYQKQYEGDERLATIVRVTKATKAECPFMENIVVSGENKTCIACGQYILSNALVCHHAGCGQKQVSDKKYAEEIARRIAASNGEAEEPKKRRGRPPSATASEPDDEESPSDPEDDDIV